ncbi:MAG: S-layer homology domain-containing protein [Clostridiaceae bacterium]|nr:S-layer homology domain-containing protein [Clostridia bacterium]MDY3869863.1 S-layer homology domain-containing protein [Clostridiaceae bacterium]
MAPGDWFAADVEYVSAHGLMDGTGNGAFSPYAGTNRAMIVTILWRLEGKPSAGSPLTFRDVPAGQWYTEAVCWAAEKGIITGYSGDKFGPTDAVTREQMAAILFRYARYKHYNVTARADLSAFTDCGKISSWAAEAMSWANAAGLVNGLGDGRLAPQSSAVRCQTAAMLHRFCKIS